MYMGSLSSRTASCAFLSSLRDWFLAEIQFPGLRLGYSRSSLRDWFVG
jgi:hypothetical protein